MFPCILNRVCRTRVRSSFPSTTASHSFLALIPTSTRTFASRSSRSSRLPDAFDDIEDRDAHLQPVSQRGLTAEEYTALTAEEQQTIRERERDIQRIEDELAEQRLTVDDTDDDYILSPATSSSSTATPTPPDATLEFDSPGNYTTAHPDLPISWQLVQTNNPELIPTLPGSDPHRPTTVRYPFIPVLTGERSRQSASVLHRWLQYNRLRNTKQFLRLERKRRTLERQREYRNTHDHTTALIATLPTTAPATAAAAATVVKNAPTNVSREHYERNSPTNYNTSDTSYMSNILTDMEAELRMNGRMSTAEKEALLNEASRVMKWAHRRMTKDAKSGYYRIMAEMGAVPEVNVRTKEPVGVREVSSTLRSGRVHGESGAAQSA